MIGKPTQHTFVMLCACAALGSVAFAQKVGDTRPWKLSVERVYTGTGKDVSGGATLSVDGAKVGSISSSRDDDRDEETLHGYAITPGLIDLSVRITSDEMSVEQSQEVTPELRVGGTLDAFSIDWDRQLRSGVTTVLVNPPDLNVIGGLGIALKTAGPESIAARTVKDNAVLRGAIGSQPSVRNRPAFQRPTSFYNRRPTTRMGVEWEWRKTFYDVALGPDEGEEPRQGRETIIAALKGEIPIAIQAWTTQDIRTAVFLREEVENGEEFKAGGLNKPRFIIDAAAEAWKEPQLLVRSKTAVVLPPFPSSGRTRDNAFMAWDVAADLQKAGVTFALSSHGLEGYDQRLPMQAGYAMSGGLGFADALAAVTITPARMIGIDGRVGSLEPGKDADLVLWSGEPFEPSSRVLAVIVDGVLRYDARDASEKK